MIAALISKIIGLIYKSPLSSTMGKESFGCFQFAQNVYFILLRIASFSIPQAVSKIMAERLAFKRYRDAQRIFKGALLYAVIVGGAVAVICIVGAPILVPDGMANARLALQFLAPTIFVSGILGVFRGYFQAYRNMLPTSISQILEQIAVADLSRHADRGGARGRRLQQQVVADGFQPRLVEEDRQLQLAHDLRLRLALGGHLDLARL